MSTPVTLHEIVNRLVKSFIPGASRNQSYFVNDIPGHLVVNRDPEVIKLVLGGLLSSTTTYVRHSCIRLSAKIYGNVILIQLKNSSGFNSNALAIQIQKLQRVAESMNAAIGVSRQRKQVTIINFGFSNI